MTLSPIDALVASWFLQSTLAIVFCITLWSMARSFDQRAIRALALGWGCYVLLVVVTLVEAWLLRQNVESQPLVQLSGALELAGVLASCTFWSPVAGLLTNMRRPILPHRRIVLIACAALVVLVGLTAVTGRTFHIPGTGPLWILYPVPYILLAYDAWRSSRRHAGNRVVLRLLTLGYLLFVVRISSAWAVMSGYTVRTASGDRLLAIASIQVLQMVAFGIICLVVALALERTAILSLAERSRNAELAAYKAQRLESLGRMTAGIAHDFNNILTAMIGAAGLARMAPEKSTEVERELGVIDDAVARARVLVRQMLDFARQQPTTPSRFVVDDLLRADTPLLCRAVGSGIAFSVDAGAPGCQVIMDPAQLSQVILNLVTNARDAIVAPSRDTPGTGPSISVRTRPETVKATRPLPEGELPPGPYVVLSVGDSGHGIAADVLSHIFEPFYTTKGGTRGTGLGLATAYRVITEIGGEIAVESSVGVGTRFDVYLPLAEPSASP